MKQLLLVCHANMLRSTSAELLTRTLGTEASEWRAVSAGTHAVVGSGTDEAASQALSARGIDPSGHRAQQLTPHLIRQADLALTFGAGRRTWVLRQQPGMTGRVLTIRRTAALLASRPRHTDPFDHLSSDTQPYRGADSFRDPVDTGTVAVARAVGEIEELLRIMLPAIGASPPDFAATGQEGPGST